MAAEPADERPAEPVLIAAIARVIVAAAAGWGFKLDATTLVPLMLALEVVLAPLVRARVSPVPAVKP